MKLKSTNLKDIYVWGAGFCGRTIIPYLVEYYGYNILGVIDNNAEGNICEIPIIKPKDITINALIIIAVLSEVDERAILKEIESTGMNNEIICCREIIQQTYEYNSRYLEWYYSYN